LPVKTGLVFFKAHEQLAIEDVDAFNPSETSAESLLRLIFYKGTISLFFI